jgi:hypothetical protein
VEATSNAPTATGVADAPRSGDQGEAFLNGAPPSSAAKRSARSLIEDDMRRLGILGPPLSSSEEKAVIAGGWQLPENTGQFARASRAELQNVRSNRTIQREP